LKVDEEACPVAFVDKSVRWLQNGVTTQLCYLRPSPTTAPGVRPGRRWRVLCVGWGVWSARMVG
jgi:hypothetical protein